jgi:hypothetical protein
MSPLLRTRAFSPESDVEAKPVSMVNRDCPVPMQRHLCNPLIRCARTSPGRIRPARSNAYN